MDVCYQEIKPGHALFYSKLHTSLLNFAKVEVYTQDLTLQTYIGAKGTNCLSSRVTGNIWSSSW